ncbi:putative acetyltransferase [[Candida] railenensis]|uniref:Acetyltransferase n=1 Tax=[Candida] railenensis TaxID=45579 RepID=A0A9P0QT36_9ASCO|nr:putative acetyltransferase [[Candida] railenensis]
MSDLVEFAHKNLKNIPAGPDYDLMIQGIPYNCFAKELMERRVVAHELAIDYDTVRLKDFDNDIEKHQNGRYEYLSKIFGKIEKDAYIEPPFYVDYGCNIVAGKGFYCNFNTTFLDCTIIKFGDGVLVGPNVTFTTATHPVDPQQRLDGVEMAYPITVGDNVWFGSNAVILAGVTIGDGAVVAAGAVVNKDVPAYTVVGGVPAKVLKKLTPPVKKEDKEDEK